MPRLIDADAFLEQNKVFADRDFNHPKYEDTLRELVDEEPTVDAVEVVRCKDCRWNNGENYCLNDGTFFELCADDAYCSFGERRTDG